MWIAILGGVAVGLLVTIFFVLRQERGYRMLFSDTHLIDFGKRLEAARVGAKATTFEGIGLAWQQLPKHVALTLTTKRPVAPTAAGFLMAFANELANKPTPLAALQTDKRSYALVWEATAINYERPMLPVTEATLPDLRKSAADAMKALPITKASLSAYR